MMLCAIPGCIDEDDNILITGSGIQIILEKYAKDIKDAFFRYVYKPDSDDKCD